jgi:arylsulfatase A-like enzyme
MFSHSIFRFLGYFRFIILGVVFGSQLIIAGTAWGFVSPGRKPNIIFVMVDDLGYGDLGCYGQAERKLQGLPAIDTPTIDLLADEGIRFTQCYSGHTVCAPSRSSLMTGQHTGHTRVRGNYSTGGYRVPLEDSDITVAEVLKQAGYATGVIGKWGLGNETSPGVFDSGIPNNQGFDYFFGYLDQAHAHDHYPDFLYENTSTVSNQRYSHDVFTEKALDFITQNQDDPFFLYLAYTLPHAEFVVPDLGPYADVDWPELEYKIYAAMVYRIDRDISQMLSLLQGLVLDNDTIIFFCSDNGPASGQVVPSKVDFFDSNGPLRGIKRDLYDGGIRVPMIVRWPGHIPAGVVSDELWAFWDVLPTLAELAGATCPADIDGISVLPALSGQPLPSRQHLYWEYIRSSLPQQAVRMGNFKAVRRNHDNPIELYNLVNDLGEANNISGAYPLLMAQIEHIMVTNHTYSADWPTVPFCGGGADLDGITVVDYSGGASAPQCSDLTIASEGSLIYTDRSFTLAAGGLPAVYEGGVLVQHANDDRYYLGYDFIELFSGHDAILAVAYQSSATQKPSWWLSDYAYTGDMITAEGFSNPEFEVRIKSVPACSTVTVPGNYAGGGNAASSYILMVIPDTLATSPPTIRLQPEDQVVLADQSATFKVVSCGTDPMSYQWEQKVGIGPWEAIPGASGSTYTIAAVPSALSGSAYRCVVNNIFGSVTSNQGLLTVTSGLPLFYSLAASWEFDRYSDDTVFDSSGNGRDGTLHGATRLIGYGALGFDGVDDYVSTDYEGIGGSEARTVCFWVKTADTARAGIVSWGDGQTNGGKWHIRLNDDPADGVVGAIRTEVGGGYLIGSTNIADGGWHHVVSLFDGSEVTEVKHYIDANLEGVSGSQAQAVNTAVAGTQTVLLGAWSAGGSWDYFMGMVDGVYIYEQAISEEVIELLAGVRPRFSADLDNDDDVDMEDFGRLQSCIAGDGVLVRVGCEDMDLDGDGDVDVADVGDFRGCLRGANVPLDAVCLN